MFGHIFSTHSAFCPSNLPFSSQSMRSRPKEIYAKRIKYNDVLVAFRKDGKTLVDDLYPRWILEKPSSHIPQPDSDGLVRYWGIEPTKERPVSPPEQYNTGYWSMTSIKKRYDRIMDQAIQYYTKKLPEVQWVEKLAQIRLNRIHSYEDSPKVCKRRYHLNTKVISASAKDFILSIRLTHTEVFRKVRVPGSISLFDLIDRVLAPVVGWSVFYHSSFIMDPTDGAVYGNMEDAYGPDSCLIPLHGYSWVSDPRVRLCDLIQEEKKVLFWYYDLGERYEHRIELSEIVERKPSRKRHVIHLVILTLLESKYLKEHLHAHQKMRMEETNNSTRGTIYPSSSTNTELLLWAQTGLRQVQVAAGFIT